MKFEDPKMELIPLVAYDVLTWSIGGDTREDNVQKKDDEDWLK